MRWTKHITWIFWNLVFEIVQFLGAGDEDSPFSDTSEDYVDPFADFETMDDDDEYETEDKWSRIMLKTSTYSAQTDKKRRPSPVVICYNTTILLYRCKF